jgi:nucleoside-diphosphate-sugar epimerase
VKVLVTGGGSLLLREAVRRLAARGDTVVCLQRRPVELPVGIEQVLGDVRDRRLVTAALEGCDAVIHGAARVGVTGSWEEFHSVNVEGTDCVLAAALEQGVSRMVHVSTPSVAHVGRALVAAPAEPAATGRRGAFYAESKALAEGAALGADSAVLGVVSVRPHLVWGPGDVQLVGRIVARARAGRLTLVGGGTSLVESTYVEDAASALVAALDAVGPGAVCAGRAYVVAGGEPRTVRELVEGICRAAGVEFAPRNLSFAAATRLGSVVENVWPRFREDEPPITRFVAEQLGTAHWFDPRPALTDLQWAPTVGVDEGLRRLGEWFASRPGWD